MLVTMGFEEESAIQQETREKHAHWQNQDKKRNKQPNVLNATAHLKGKRFRSSKASIVITTNDQQQSSPMCTVSKISDFDHCFFQSLTPTTSNKSSKSSSSQMTPASSSSNNDGSTMLKLLKVQANQESDWSNQKSISLCTH